jgi:hypothetical protein
LLREAGATPPAFIELRIESEEEIWILRANNFERN